MIIPTTLEILQLYTYDPAAGDDVAQALAKRVLRARKGSGYAQALVELCSDADLPEIIVEALNRISDDLPNDLSREGNEVDIEAVEVVPVDDADNEAIGPGD